MDNQWFGGGVQLRRLLDGEPEGLRNSQPVVILGRRMTLIVEQARRRVFKASAVLFDNAIDADELRPYLPRGGAARVLVTSNAYAWRGIAEPVEIHLWPMEIGADFLVARIGRENERAAGVTLSEALGGLPLAHEQAAAYCERLTKFLRPRGAVAPSQQQAPAPPFPPRRPNRAARRARPHRRASWAPSAP
jgi:hypothetical protein